MAVRLGEKTLEDDHLIRAVNECHGRLGIWGFSVLEVPGGDYAELVRLRPFVAMRRRLHLARAELLVSSGFPLLPTFEHPHWTVQLPEPTPERFAEVRRHFTGPVDNPAWVGRGSPVP
jgi:hypothetical protein